MQLLIIRTVEINVCKISQFWHHSFIVSLWRCQPTLVIPSQITESKQESNILKDLSMIIDHSVKLKSVLIWTLLHLLLSFHSNNTSQIGLQSKLICPIDNCPTKYNFSRIHGWKSEAFYYVEHMTWVCQSYRIIKKRLSWWHMFSMIDFFSVLIEK